MDSDWDQLDSVLLLSGSDIIDIYHQMLRTAMENAAADLKHKAVFDGNLQKDEAENLAAFCNVHQISPVSQALAEVLIFMERSNDKKVPVVQETAVYNSLLRLEKSVSKISNWEIYGHDHEGPLLDLTTLENNLIEQQISTYIADMLSENKTEVLFFPLDNFYSSKVIVKWRILEKIATIKLSFEETIYKQKLKFHLKERLKTEVSSWLKKEMEKLKLSNTYTVRKDIESLTKLLKDLQSQVTMAMDVTLSETLFKEANCSYSEVLIETIDDFLFPVCERVMELMDSYQIQHRSYHVNMRDSCALSHSCYLQLKKLYNILAPDKKMDENLRLQGYVRIFVKFFMNLLQVIKMECHNRIKRAVQAELKDNVHITEKILSSSVIVLNCLCTVIDEWKHLEIDEEEQKIAFLVKITDVVCDGAKIYAESLECRLQSLTLPLKDMETMKKVCVFANSVKHVLQYLQDLPQQMQWSAILQDDSDDSLKKQVLRILSLIHESMNTQSSEIISRMLAAVANGICNSTEKLLTTWLQSQATYQSFDKFLAHLNENLEIVDDSLKDELFPQLLSHLWSSLLSYIERGFQEGQPPEYARTIKESILSFKDYMESINMTELDVHKPLLLKLMELLDLNSKTTEELQLDYYLQIAESIVSPVEYLGHIAFQAGYKTAGNDLIDLYINVQKGQRLPARKCEMSQLIVKVELCPNTLFPPIGPLKSSPVTEDLDNPVFDSFFHFSKLPINVLDVKGAAAQVLVLNQDYSYSAEAILLLNQVQNMSGIASFEFLPVYLMPLRKFDMSHISYQVLENRSRWDKNAKIFINKRGKLSKNQKKFLPCISGKNIMCTFSRND